MALYDFKCTNEKCGKEFEERVSLTEFDTKVVKCPECDAEAKRVLAAMKSGHTSWKTWRL